MPRKPSLPDELNDLQTLSGTLAKTIDHAARGLRPLLKREKIAGLDLDRAILTRVGDSAVAHCAIKLPRPITVADLSKRSHLVGVIVVTGRPTEGFSETTLEPGAYAVRLRPAGHCQFAFDLVRGDGGRALVVPAQKKQDFPEPDFKLDLIIIDIEINPPDDILNPFATYVCFSFLWWRGCLHYP